MSGGPAVRGTSIRGGSGDRRVAGLVVMMLAAFLGVAIVKPWGAAPAVPASPAEPSGTKSAVPPSAIETIPPRLPGEVTAAFAGPLPVAFTTPAPPPASATWSGLRWRQLTADDPLSLVTSVVRSSGGFIAVGFIDRLPATPVWTSADGRRWDPLPFDGATTFWHGLAVLGVAGLPAGLVALTETAQYCGAPCPLRFELPVVSWTSADGRRWTPHVLPPEWLSTPTGIAPLFAAGPAGLVVASSGAASRLATSTDGSHWRLLPAGGFPARFALDDLRGTTRGYVATGRWVTGDGRPDVSALWSVDGRHWSGMPTLLPVSPGRTLDFVPGVTTLVSGRDGLIAIGRSATGADAAPWWQSSDGRRWRSLDGYPPLGAVSPGGAGLPWPRGELIGDGGRLVVVRGGPEAAAWVSRDGLAWQELTMSGDLPSALATRATLLPGGVLLSDGSATWFGEAVVG